MGTDHRIGWLPAAQPDERYRSATGPRDGGCHLGAPIGRHRENSALRREIDAYLARERELAAFVTATDTDGIAEISCYQSMTKYLADASAGRLKMTKYVNPPNAASAEQAAHAKLSSLPMAFYLEPARSEWYGLIKTVGEIVEWRIEP